MVVAGMPVISRISVLGSGGLDWCESGLLRTFCGLADYRRRVAAEHTVWITKVQASEIAPGLSASRLDYLRRESKYTGISAPPSRVLSDGEVLYDELLFRRWLESTVSCDWVSGFGNDGRPTPSADRRYSYQDAGLELLRGRTYITEQELFALLPAVPVWRVRDLRFRAVGPRFLKPTPRTVIYIAEEARHWAENVEDFSDPMRRDEDWNRLPPFTPPPQR